MREVSGAVIAIVLVLCAVFIPVAFLGGIAGQLYRQFAVTVAIAVVISGFIALTLTPALCALLLQDRRTTSRASSGRSTAASRWTTQRFLGGVEPARSGTACVSLLVFVAVLALAVLLFWRVPGELRAARGPGLHHRLVSCPTAPRCERTRQDWRRSCSRCSRSERRRSTTCSSSTASTSSAAATRPTRRRCSSCSSTGTSARHAAPQRRGRDHRRQGQAFRDGMAFAFNPPAIRGLGTAGGFEVYVQARADADPRAAGPGDCRTFIAALAQASAAAPASTRSSARRCRSCASRSTARRRCRSACRCSDVFDALQSTMGALYVNDFNMLGPHLPRADAGRRAVPRAARTISAQVYVRSTTTRRDDPAQGADHTSATSSGPSRSSASTASSRRKVLGNGKPGRELGRGDRGGGGSRGASAARRATRSPGPARRSRKSAPAAPRSSPSASRSSWSS